MVTPPKTAKREYKHYLLRRRKLNTTYEEFKVIDIPLRTGVHNEVAKTTGVRTMKNDKKETSKKS
jgi:hypothetical protein